MQLKDQEAPIATELRDELGEKRKPGIAPGTKLILAAVAAMATGMIIYGIGSKTGMWGNSTEAAAAKRSQKKTAEPTAPKAPRLAIPAVASPPVAAQQTTAAATGSNVCPNGQRLPDGMPLSMCPYAGSGANNQQGDQGSQPNTGHAGGQDAKKVPSKFALTADQLRERRLGGDLTVAATDEKEGAAGAPGLPGMPSSSMGGMLGAGSGQSSRGDAGTIGSQLVATDTPGTIAKLKLNQDLTLARGTLPDCTLMTAIRTSQPGFIRCVLAQPVYSMNGKVLLMEPGTQVNGEYQQGVQQGQKAIFTVWTDAVTPKGVKIQLNSPGTDQLGRAGTDGYIDNKWMERYAGALFYSLFDDVMSLQMAKASENQGSNNVTLYPNSSGAAKSIIEEMLKQGSQIKPDLYKLQGETVRIFVARDVDFSTVYQLRSAKKEF